MSFIWGLSRQELQFSVVIAAVHASQHLFLRILPPLIPILVVEFNASLWQLGLLVSVYLFSGGLFQAPMGILSDKYDRRFLLTPAFLTMSAGYMMFLIAPSLGGSLPDIVILGQGYDGSFQVMALGMFISGIGYSIIHPVGYPLISMNTTADNKGKVLGIWGSASKLGDAGAPLLVGFLILFTGWQTVLYLIILFGIAMSVIVFTTLQGPAYSTAPITDSGDGKNNKNIKSLLVNPEQFLYPLVLMVFALFFILFSTNGLVTYAPLFVSEVYAIEFSVFGLDFQPESVANLYFTVLLLSGGLSQLFIGSVSQRFDHRMILIVLLGISTLLFILLSGIVLSPELLFLTFLLMGGTIFGLNPVRDAIISDITPVQYEGRVFGYVWTVALLGSSAYPTIIGYVGEVIGIQPTFAILAIGSFGGLVCISLLYVKTLAEVY